MRKAAKCRDAAREVRRDERVLEAVERAHVGRLAHANNVGIIRWGRHTNFGYGVNSVRHFVLRHGTQIQRVRFMRLCDAVPRCVHVRPPERIKRHFWHILTLICQAYFVPECHICSTFQKLIAKFDAFRLYMPFEIDRISDTELHSAM